MTAAANGQELAVAPAEPLPVIPPGASPQDATAWLRSCGVLANAVQAGEMVPDFELADTAGAPVGLGALLDRGPLVISFVLGSESPVCRASLRALQGALPLFESHRGSIVAISPDQPAASHRLAQEDCLGFKLLADDDGHLAALFGLVYQPPQPLSVWLKLLGLGRCDSIFPPRLILPAAYVINGDGIAVYAFLDPDPRHRVDPQALIGCLSRLG